MKFLDSTGLSYFYNKLKEKFVHSVNNITPDVNGNVAITNVPTADNLTSPDNQTSYDSYIYRTSGGDVSLESGNANLIYVDGNISIVGRTDEEFNISAQNNIKFNINFNTWRASNYGNTSGTYNFIYTASTNSWSPSLETYGITASNVIVHNATATVAGSITAANVNLTTWETKITTTGFYYFVYSQDKWYRDTTEITLASYGITITGTPANGDLITVQYNASTPDSVVAVEYIKGNQGTIHVATPTGFSATGFNQCDPSTMYIADAKIVNNLIVNEVGSIICYCKAVGGVTNGYVAYSSGGYITNIGWCASQPAIGSTVTTTGQDVSTTLASIPFDTDGYVVVVVSDKSDICIHPKWSGSADTTYKAYVAPSVIAFPTKDINNNNLPLASYGMPAIGNVADRLNLDEGTYIQRIGRYIYTPSNLSTVQAMNVPYDYDDTNIFYVLTNPITYQVTISSNYIVDDFGTEEFLNTNVPLIAQTIYGQNLRDKLRLDVEPKKLLFNNVTVATTAFNADGTYEDYAYKATISLAGVTSTMIPDVMFSMAEATSGNFAPIAETYNGGIYLYAVDAPENDFIIPTIICWRKTT